MRLLPPSSAIRGRPLLFQLRLRPLRLRLHRLRRSTSSLPHYCTPGLALEQVLTHFCSALEPLRRVLAARLENYFVKLKQVSLISPLRECLRQPGELLPSQTHARLVKHLAQAVKVSGRRPRAFRSDVASGAHI